MTRFHILLILLIGISMTLSGCLNDLEKYDDFVCERFGGDNDNDGSCSSFDCNDFNPNIYPAAPCDDGDPETVNDAYNDECECVGE